MYFVVIRFMAFLAQLLVSRSVASQTQTWKMSRVYVCVCVCVPRLCVTYRRHISRLGFGRTPARLNYNPPTRPPIFSRDKIGWFCITTSRVCWFVFNAVYTQEIVCFKTNVFGSIPNNKVNKNHKCIIYYSVIFIVILLLDKYKN